jgi:hypothetical protein
MSTGRHEEVFMPPSEQHDLTASRLSFRRVGTRWLAVAGAVVLLVIAGLFFLHGHQSHKSQPDTAVATATVTATATAPAASQGDVAQQQAGDADVKVDMRNAAIAVETWFTVHGNYKTHSLPTGQTILASDHLDVKLAADGQGYCLRGWSAGGTASGPSGRLYLYYDSTSGGLQAGPTAVSPSASRAANACASIAAYLPFH